MKIILTITRKELSYFAESPVVYAMTICTLLISGLNLFSTIQNAAYYNLSNPVKYIPTIQSIISPILTLLIVTIPALTMRAFSEENRSGTLELLMTLPITDPQLVIGKWLGAFTLTIVILISTLVFPLILLFITKPGIDVGLLISNYLGLFLFSGGICAIGVSISTFFRNQLASFFSSLTIVLLFWFIVSPADSMGDFGSILKYLDMRNHFFSTFYQGIIDVKDMVYFLSITLLFIVIGILALDSKRWNG